MLKAGTETVSTRFHSHVVLAGIMTAIFFILGGVGVIHHEMWRDELQPWMIVKDSNSLINLFENLKYESHSALLWHLLLYPISRFTHNPVAMQWYHLLIATGSIYLLWRFAPFTDFQKLLLSFSYFLFYEYSLISRSYALGVLLIFTLCAAYRRFQSYLPLACILFFLAHTNVYSLILAIALGSTLFLQQGVAFFLNRNLTKLLAREKWDLLSSCLIFGLGVLTGIFQLIPPPDSSYDPGWYFQFDMGWLQTTLTTIWKGYVPIPTSSIRFWNTNLFEVFPTEIQTSFALILVIIVMSLLIRYPFVFFLYFCGTLGVLAFTYIKYFGFSRHHGHLFVLLIVCLWLAQKEHNLAADTRWEHFLNAVKEHFTTLIFSLQLIGGVFAFSMDLLHPFSASQAVAEFIRQEQLQHLTIIGARDFAVSPIAGFLDKRIYYPEGDRFGSFIIWDQRRWEISSDEILQKVKNIIQQQGTEVLLVLNYPLAVHNTQHLNIAPPIHFSQSIVSDETYYVYRIQDPQKLLDSK